MQSGIAQDRLYNLKRTAESTIGRLYKRLFHVTVVLSILALVTLSGPMSSIDVRENSARVLASASGATNGSLDEATSTFVAANIASGLGISAAEDITARSEAISSGSQLVSSDNTHLRKASAVATDNVSRDDITTYTVKSGDTVSDIARKFGITSDTVRWANDIPVGGSISAGDKLTILPINGVLHKVASGDTPEKLADKYEANAALIISFNDAEVTGLVEGQKIVVPDGAKDEPVFNPATSYFANTFLPSYGFGNGYVYGYCTWYVAERIDIPNNWGNAVTWAAMANIHPDWHVISTPVPGAIAQRAGGWGGLGHVGVVEEVSPDGSKFKMSDMNGFAGWGAVGSGWVSSNSFPSYIVPR